ncbi:hypothetical protein UCRPA7_8438 [Phaeoacremonium minimum UCRPA7]|uniref:Uncharacterized protein n=1 Tax=Phaeoacremonium minimum (strain UCR-PA7) TaxID=1286976 RepID=R8B9X9_PHAM7|nr:hypothetical protein UCRPA7_8438 [Phaeoacremonium minimum UCRPA7]EON96086.1 hypothetical protein UCRPA7_8438 [Phaeoacremonium minimum UCRPA7]
MNVFPVNSERRYVRVDAETKRLCTLIRTKRHLPLPAGPDARPTFPTESGSIADMFRVVANLPRGAAVVLDVIEEVKKMPSLYLRYGSMTEVLENIRAKMSNSDGAKSSVPLQPFRDSNQAVITDAEKILFGSDIGKALQEQFGRGADKPWATPDIVNACHKSIHLFQFFTSAALGVDTYLQRIVKGEVQEMLPKLRRSLGNSHAVLTMRFCQQVLGANFSLMERHERVEAFKSFGVDVDYLSKDEYTEELVKDRLSDFCTLYKSFSNQCGNIVQQSGLAIS